jgi:hypothetical protein
LLAEAAAAPDDAAVARLVQRALDPLCLATVEVPVSGAVQITPNPSIPPLVEQGWQTYLVKVINGAGVTNPLRMDSPNARPVPGGPAEQVKMRWLDIAPFYHRPLQANLSGLGLEYQVVQLYSRDAGQRTATIAFDAGTSSAATAVGVAKSSVRAWSFEKGADGWEALNDLNLVTRGGQLIVRTRGVDPFMSAPVRLNEGEMRLRIRATVDHDDMMQLFWATEDAPDFSGNRQAVFAIQKTSTPREYTVTFPVKGDLTQLRLDPGSGAGVLKIDWIELVCVDGPANWAKADFAFRVQPSTPVTFRVQDGAGKPATAAFIIRDARDESILRRVNGLRRTSFFSRRSTGRTARRSGCLLAITPSPARTARNPCPKRVP